MTDNPQPEKDLSDEFRALGENLVKALQSIWDSPERRRLQQEIENGLNELASTLHKEARAFNDSPTGQQLKADFEDLRQRVRSGEAEDSAREELLKALKLMNTELERVVSRWSKKESSDGESKPPPAA